MTDIPQDQVEAVSRAIEEAKSYPGPMSDAKWAEIWQWYTNPENCRNAGGSWETIRSAKAAIRVLTPMIAEQCAQIADTYAGDCTELLHGDKACDAMLIHRANEAKCIAESIRTVKGAVT